MECFLTPDGFVLSKSGEGVYFVGWLTIDQDEGVALEKISSSLPADTIVTPVGKYIN
jgi:hypothetical protein